MSEIFEEWWELFELECIRSDDNFKVIDIVESAWNHQQKKIEELEKKLAKKDKVIAEAVEGESYGAEVFKTNEGYKGFKYGVWIATDKPLKTGARVKIVQEKEGEE